MTYHYRGKSLKELRVEKNLNLRRLSEETRITTWYLTGIEEERFDRFPGRFYFKSFTRQYARLLGLDPTEVLSDLQSAYDAWEEKRKPTTPGEGVSIGDGSLLGLLHFRPKGRPPEV